MKKFLIALGKTSLSFLGMGLGCILYYLLFNWITTNGKQDWFLGVLVSIIFIITFTTFYDRRK